MKTRGSKSLLFLHVLCIFMLCFTLPVNAEEKDKDVLTVEYLSSMTRTILRFEVPWQDAWFKEDARVYNHQLAQASLGLMAASFRTSDKEDIQSVTLLDGSFLKQAGFDHFRFDDYDKPPGRYTIASIIGRKTIETEEGPFTLIAIGVSGQGYRDEWLSNLAIGAGDVHEGFSQAANCIYDRFFGYLASEHITGRYKVWVTGYSRAAAVSNLFAARLSQDEIMSNEDVFAYTFATPRVVKDPEEGQHGNIFNIVGMVDPVPTVPFKDWGFERFGTTYFTPAQQTTSGWYEKQQKANAVYKDLVGFELWNNPAIDMKIKTLTEYLLEICPTNALYEKHLQEKIQTLWSSHTPAEVLETLIDISQNSELITEENMDEANSLLDFALYTFVDYLTRSEQFGYFEDKASPAANIVHEHTPELYIAWMLSTDNPEELFTDCTEFTRDVFRGSLSAEIYDPKSGKILETVDPGGGITYYSDQKRLFASSEDDMISLIIPNDQDYTVTVKSKTDQKVLYYSIEYTCEQTRITEYSSDILSLKKDKDFTISHNPAVFDETDETGDRREERRNTVFYSGTLSEIQIYERLNLFNLSWRNFTVMIISVTSLLLSMIVFGLVYLIGFSRLLYGKKRGTYDLAAKYYGLPVFCLCLVYVLFLTSEFTSALYPYSSGFKTLIKAVIGFLLIFVSFHGYRRNRSSLNKWNLIAMILFSVADLIINYQMEVALLVRTLATLAIAYGFFLERKPAIWQWIFFTALIVLSAWFITSRHPSDLRIIAFEFNLAAAILLFVLSFPIPSRFRNGAWLLLISGILLVFDRLEISTFVSHLFSAGVYYTAMVFFAAGSVKMIRLSSKTSAAPPAEPAPAKA